MPKLDKVQRDHIIGRLSAATSVAIRDKEDSLKTRFTSEEVAEKLRAKGFIVSDKRYHYVELPPTAAMVANKQKIVDFTEAAQEARRNAIDEVMLGDAEGALQILKDFTAKLAKL